MFQIARRFAAKGKTEKNRAACAGSGEQRNLTADPAATGELAAVRQWTLDFLMATGDVLPHELDRRE